MIGRFLNSQFGKLLRNLSTCPVVPHFVVRILNAAGEFWTHSAGSEMAPVFGGFLKRDGCLQGLCDLLCLFGQLTQQNCLQMSVHNVTVHNLKVHTEALCMSVKHGLHF